MISTYDKHPFVAVTASHDECLVGWPAIGARLSTDAPLTICVECYPGVFIDEVAHGLAAAFTGARVVLASACFKGDEEIDRLLAPYLTSDPVFGRMNAIRIDDLLDPARTIAMREDIDRSRRTTVVIGAGAALIVPDPDVLVYADMARWELQMRQRRNEIGNLGTASLSEPAGLKYKRAFFVDWRAADRLKRQLFPRIDFLLDTNERDSPKLISGDVFRRALQQIAKRPFRVVPFFDPGPWGGQWMRSVCDLPDGPPNYAWCFDCVPEENSLLLGFGRHRVEVPAIDLVFFQPRDLLGDAVHARFGTEFPIRFDFLDTMAGGNLSLQVHPLTEYIQDAFGLHYTQDESYYLLDAADDAVVYLGLKEGVDRTEMLDLLRQAQEGDCAFPAERFVNAWPARKHDHFLIPAGTIHCSGRNSMVLEISATPYIFTFKLWDWDRMGLDGRPRPIHLDHGEANIQWDRTTAWVRTNLVNRIEATGQGEGWCEERTGLHEREFIETRRHWFTDRVPHDTGSGVNVLNLVEGPEAIVESPENAFEPFVVHYAETFIVPAAVGRYTIRPGQPGRCATIKAYVRTNP